MDWLVVKCVEVLGKSKLFQVLGCILMYNTGDKYMHLCCEHKIFPYMWINMGMAIAAVAFTALSLTKASAAAEIVADIDE